MIETRQTPVSEAYYRTAPATADYTYKDELQRFGPDAFNLEYNQSTHNASLHDDLIGYLGEYRLELQKHHYTLLLTEEGLADVHTGESLETKAERAILERQRQGLSVEREIAEKTALSSMRIGAKFIQNGDTILWASPPGPKAEGYGDYGFLFVGHITGDGKEKKAVMTAIRLDNPTLSHYSSAMSQLTGTEIQYQNAVQFLQSPQLLKGILGEEEVDAVLAKTFPYTVTQDRGLLQRFLKAHGEHITECISIFRTGTKEEKLDAFHTIENLAIAFRKNSAGKEHVIYEHGNGRTDLRFLMKTNSDEPEEVGGSCGSSSGKKKKSNNPLANGYETLFDTFFGDEESSCEHCEENAADDHYHCPDCSKRYASETSKAVEQRTKKCDCGFEFWC